MPLATFTLDRPGATMPVWHREGDGTQWILLLHGSGVDHRSMEVLLEGLPASADVLLPDLRGQGDSVLTPDGHATFEEIVADCVALLDHVGAGSVTIIGHSYGSHLTQELGWLLPERVDRMVLIGCHDQHRRRTWGERMRRALTARVQGHPRRGREVFSEFEQSRLRAMHPVDGYDQPILLIAGAREYSRTLDRRYASIARRTHAVGIQVVEDAGHMCPQEQPAEVSEAIAEFLAR